MELATIFQALISGLLMGGVYGLVAVGLTLVFGVMRVINFAHGSFLMLGMYISYWSNVYFGIDPYVSIVITIIILFAIGVFIQAFLLNKVMEAPEHVPLLVTLGLWLFIDNLALLLWGPDFRTVKVSYATKTFVLGDIVFSYPRLLAFGFAFLISYLLYLLLKKTDLGKSIRAISDEKIGSKLMGINVNMVNCITMGVGAACAGIAGTLIVPFYHMEPGVGDSYVVTAFVVVVLGGLGNFVGSLVGGIILGICEAMGAILLPGSMKILVTYLIFFLVLLFKPTGLFGTTK